MLWWRHVQERRDQHLWQRARGGGAHVVLHAASVRHGRLRLHHDGLRGRSVGRRQHAPRRDRQVVVWISENALIEGLAVKNVFPKACRSKWTG